MDNSKVDEAAQARRELTKSLAKLGTVVADNVKTTAQTVIADTLNVAESHVKTSLSQINPRGIIRANPIASLAGAFVTGLVLTSRLRPGQKTATHPIMAAATGLGLDLLRAYAMLHINRIPGQSANQGSPSSLH